MAKKPGLYANIHAKRKRIAAGSGERMRKPGSKGAPTAKQFKRAAKTAKKRRQNMPGKYGKKMKTGGKKLTAKQKTLPKQLQQKIMKSKKK